MAKKEFILQGFTTRTHGDAIKELFDVANIQRVLLSVAFISAAGVTHLEEKLKTHGKKLTVFAGIRNDISTYQALSLLHSYGGSLFAVDTGARTIVFHPKLYLVRGDKAAKAIIGSANLTLGGLNNNIEAGMLLHFDLTDKDDRELVENLEAQIDAIPVEHPLHAIKVTAVKLLDEWLASGRLVDEMAVRPPRPSTSTTGSGGDSLPRIKLKVTQLRAAIKKAKAAKKPAPKKAVAAAGSATKPVAATGVALELVWESKALTRRDLTIPNAGGTHATGSINLDKGLLSAEVDHRHYFRDEVFSALTWAPAKKGVDEAYAKFQIVLKGISHGEYDLRIGHTTSTTSESYNQRNAMTRMSWGPVRPLIARPDLIGRNLALFRDTADPTRFVLEID